MTNVYLGIINPKSPTNMGAIMRAAGCYGVSQVNYTGQRYSRAQSFIDKNTKLATDTKNVAKRIPLKEVADLHAALPANMQAVAVELTQGATPLPDFTHPENACYIFGPEDGSIPQQVLDQCDHVVYIPTTGCMNLAATVNVVLYDRLAKSANSPAGDDLILASRDTNNRTEVQKR